MATNSQPQSGESTPNARFKPTAASAEDLLKEQTIGLIHLSEYRKRRADALEQSGQDSSDSDGRNVRTNPALFKKRRKKAAGALSFGDDELIESEPIHQQSTTTKQAHSRAEVGSVQADHDDMDTSIVKKRLKANTSVGFTPRSQSKTAVAKEAQLKQALHKEYLEKQELVKNTDFVLPFVFFDGKDSTGGKVRVRKGDHIWLFLEHARKVGAETGGKTNAVRKDWARISVDDLMVVRDDLILPPHFDFYYFIQHQSRGYHGAIFNLSAEPTQQSSDAEPPPKAAALHPSISSTPATQSDRFDSKLEGFSDDPALTKVVDRRWYERNKHIFPASIWEDFDPERDYSQGGRKDRQGNQIFFSR